MTADVFCSALPTQLLGAAAALQALGLAGFLAQRRRAAAWPLVFLVPGGAAGLWYAALARDLVLGAAQALILLACLRLSRRRTNENKETHS